MTETTETTTMKVKMLTCRRPLCGYSWYPKPGRGLPKVCPSCKSHKWDVAPKPAKKAA